jgi:Tol biopolymer transport system component
LIYPIWLPTGQKLLFIHNNQIYSIKPDKTDLKQITGELGDNSNYSISPDGQKIVFNNIENYKSRVFITDIDGSNCQPITDRYGFMLYDVQWFANGNYIIFSKYDTTLTRQIFRMDSNGENIKQLTFYDGGQRSYPLCTPDRKIIYYSNNTRDLQIIDINGENKSQLIKLENSYSLYFTISGLIGI